MPDILVTLPPETERRLREKAGAAGLTLEGYLRQLAEKDAANGVRPQPQGQTFDEILAPAREGFAESGMNQDELNALFEEARSSPRKRSWGRFATSWPDPRSARGT